MSELEQEDLEQEVEQEVEVEAEEEEELSPEERASMVGWNKDYDGPGAKSAEEFLEKRENDLGLANANIRQLEGKVDRMSKFLESAQKRAEKQGYDRAMAEIKQRQRDAVENADVAAFEAAEKDEEELQREYEESQKPENVEDQQAETRQQIAAVAQDYQKRYPEVFETKSQANEWVEELLYAAQRGAKSWHEAADRATRAVSKKYGLGKVPGPDDSGGGGGKAKKRGFANLPKEAKADFEMFKAKNPNLDKEEFAKIYYEEWGDE